MRLLRSSDKIDEKSDFVYNGPDYQNFPACSLCMNYSPFLFYVTSFNAMASLKGIVNPKMNIFCVECLPRESANGKTAGRPFYSMECLFNSPEIVSLFRGYRYSNPYYFLYSDVDRIIITENAKISSSYKKLMRKPLPRNVKVQQLAQLFDPVHRMRFERHSDVVAVFQALRAKHLEIMRFYENASNADLHDNYDVLTNRSPMGVTRRVERRFPGYTPTLRAVTPSDDSLSDANSTVIAQERNDLEHSEHSRVMASISTQESTERNTNSQSVEPYISSQSLSSVINNSNEVMASTQESTESEINTQPNISSQSLSSMIGIQIPSESIDDEVPARMALATIREPNVSSTSSSANDITVSRRVVVPQRKGRVVFHDSQEAGPSGLQQQQQGRDAEPHSKRRRTMPPPTNPSHNNFPHTRRGFRYPRLHGG